MKLSAPSHQSIMPAVMAHSSDLKLRLLRVLDEDTSRAPVTARFITCCAIAVILVTMPMSMLRFWAGDAKSLNAIAATPFPNGSLVDLHFDGAGDHVEVPDSDAFDFEGDFTLEARIKVADLSEYGQNRILISKHLSHAQIGEWVLTILGPPNPVGRIQFTVWNGASGSYTARSDPGAIVAGEEHCMGWQTIAFCCRRSTGEWWFFVDGQSAGSGVGQFNIEPTDYDVWLGWEIGEPSHEFDGWMREVRVSECVRHTSPYDAAAEWGNDAYTIAHWIFEEGAGGVLHDTSGNGHNGTIVGASWDACMEDVIEVEPGTDLQPVVDAAPNGAQIVLLAGVHLGPVVIANKHLTIRGVGVDLTTLDAGANTNDYAVLVKSGGSLLLSDLTVTHCYNDSPGEYYYPAALTIDGGHLDVEHVLFIDNLNGIGAWREASVVQVTESTFLTGTAVAAFTRDAGVGTRIALTSCTIEGNRTDSNHGLLKMWGGSMQVDRSVLEMANGRAIEYHWGSWLGSCNIVHAIVQASGGLTLPADHWNVDPKLCVLNGWEYSVYPESPALPENNACSVRIGTSGSCATGVEDTSWSRIKSLY